MSLLAELRVRSQTMVDFRSDKSNSYEGEGKARAAWNAYVRGVGFAISPVSRRIAQRWTSEMIGFWVVWHLHGGFDGLRETGMSEATIWRKIKRFRIAFGEHPDTFRMPGVALDRKAYWQAANKAVGKK
jgi:hypothetical protein